jgi:5'(3')-deoxyribonucleotidase
MTRRRIYLDCDGVLADFDRGAEAVLGMPPDRFTRRFGLKSFWSRLAKAPDFFERLEPLPDAQRLYEAVKHRDPIILTGLPRGAWAEPQKRRWAERHFPGVEVITTSAALKREHCHPGDALVDDNPRYAHLWEAEGGIFIHHRSAAASIEALRDRGFLSA